MLVQKRGSPSMSLSTYKNVYRCGNQPFVMSLTHLHATDSALQVASSAFSSARRQLKPYVFCVKAAKRGLKTLFFRHLLCYYTVVQNKWKDKNDANDMSLKSNARLVNNVSFLQVKVTILRQHGCLPLHLPNCMCSGWVRPGRWPLTWNPHDDTFQSCGLVWVWLPAQIVIELSSRRDSGLRCETGSREHAFVCFVLFLSKTFSGQWLAVSTIKCAWVPEIVHMTPAF